MRGKRSQSDAYVSSHQRSHLELHRASLRDTVGRRCAENHRRCSCSSLTCVEGHWSPIFEAVEAVHATRIGQGRIGAVPPPSRNDIEGRKHRAARDGDKLFAASDLIHRFCPLTTFTRQLAYLSCQIILLRSCTSRNQPDIFRSYQSMQLNDFLTLLFGVSATVLPVVTLLYKCNPFRSKITVSCSRLLPVLVFDQTN